ncbi:MAG TPA: TIGR03618 family F420-dependent PPOX class oxidoreductase [Mycobacteriales bacterium]|nr:TIGR03618 family F420-dependent PPOX class oxidoreductase [Mycobacteriales bacterium]
MEPTSNEGVTRLIANQTNHGVVSTLNEDGSIHNAVVWVNIEDGKVAVNSAVGRRWPTNLVRDPRVTVTVYDEANPYEYVSVRGTATSRLDIADAHIDRLAKKYKDLDAYPYRASGEQRISFLIDPTAVVSRGTG